MKCCDIVAGQLNRKVEIYRLVRTSDGQGGETEAPSLVASPWARLTPKSGSEKVHADRLDAHGLSSVVIRYRDDLDESMYLVYRSRNYQIRSIINVEEADEWTELTIERGVAT